MSMSLYTEGMLETRKTDERHTEFTSSRDTLKLQFNKGEEIERECEKKTDKT